MRCIVSFIHLKRYELLCNVNAGLKGYPDILIFAQKEMVKDEIIFLNKSSTTTMLYKIPCSLN